MVCLIWNKNRQFDLQSSQNVVPLSDKSFNISHSVANITLVHLLTPQKENNKIT